MRSWFAMWRLPGPNWGWGGPSSAPGGWDHACSCAQTASGGNALLISRVASFRRLRSAAFRGRAAWRRKRCWGALCDRVRGCGEDKLLAGIGERVVGDQRGDVAQLGGFRFEEFAARGDGIKEIGDADGGSWGQSGGLDADELASGEFHAGAVGIFVGAGFEEQARNRSDGRESF